MRVPRLTPDTSSLRESRELRLVVLGNVVSSIGSQATLVALPYQLYVETHSALLVGLLGAAELVPLATMALLGGAIADRMDRRRLLLFDQVGLVAIAAGLAIAAFMGHPAVLTLYLLGGALAGFTSLQNVARAAIVPNLVSPRSLRSALALTYGLQQVTMVVGPGIGGVMIAAVGLPWTYLADAVSCFAMVFAVIAIAPQPPTWTEGHESVRRSIAQGLRYVASNQALLGSFAIDLVAMTFGMPRALFAVLAVSYYHAGASGTGVLYAAVSAGASIGALTTGWLTHARRLGLIVIWSVVVWGSMVALVALAGSLWVAAALLAVAGAADSVSAVCRSTINQTVTPDRLRGRMSAVFSLVVTSGPRLGDIESGSVAGAAGPRFSVLSGGLACLFGVVVIVAAFPALARYGSDRPAATEGAGGERGEPASARAASDEPASAR
ncbi:MAG: MFS transporter [Solirubrobacterales bacterium]|nr:MFS transporter [Solirubrobacterales bacterium]